MGSMRLLIPLLICATSALYAADKVVGGPYVVNPAARSATIGWVVETDGVKTGAAPDQLTRRIPVLRSEKTSMPGLRAGETVYYEIPGAAPADQRTRHLKTPPPRPAP